MERPLRKTKCPARASDPLILITSSVNTASHKQREIRATEEKPRAIMEAVRNCGTAGDGNYPAWAQVHHRQDHRP